MRFLVVLQLISFLFSAKAWVRTPSGLVPTRRLNNQPQIISTKQHLQCSVSSESSSITVGSEDEDALQIPAEERSVNLPTSLSTQDEPRAVAEDSPPKYEFKQTTRSTPKQSSSLYLSNFPDHFVEEDIVEMCRHLSIEPELSVEDVSIKDETTRPVLESMGGDSGNNGGRGPQQRRSHVSGRPNKFAFLRRPSYESACAALAALEPHVEGRFRLKVGHFVPRAARPAIDVHVRRENCVFLKDVHHSITQSRLEQLCEQHAGEDLVATVRMSNYEVGKLGAAYVYTRTPADAIVVMKALDGLRVDPDGPQQGEDIPPVRAQLHHRSSELGRARLQELLQGMDYTPGEHAAAFNNLAYGLTESMIEEMLQDCLEGNFVEKVTVPLTDRGQHSGAAIVEFNSAAPLERTVRELNEMVVLGRPLAIFKW